MTLVRAWRAVWMLSALVCGACDSDTAIMVDGGTDDAAVDDAATDAMADDAAAPGIQPCRLEDRRDCVPSQYFRLQLLLGASTFGPDARFTALDGDAVLAQRPSGPDILARVNPWDSSDTVEMTELPENFLSIDLWSPSADTFIIGCDSVACHLLHKRAYEGDVEVIEDSTLPFTAAPRGIIAGRHYSEALGEYLPCVYGQGLWCFDGTEWQEELADEPLAAVTLSNPQVAVTTDGRVWFHGQDASQWTPVTNVLSSQPRWVDNYASGNTPRAGLLLDDTAWAWINADGTAEQCSLETTYAALRAVPGTGTVVGLSHDGEGSFYSQWSDHTTTFLCTNPDIPLESLVDLGSATCGIISNVRILTTDSFWGTSFCAIY